MKFDRLPHSSSYSAQAQNLTVLTFDEPLRLLVLELDQQAPDRRNPSKQGVALRIVPSFQHKEATLFSRKRYPNTPDCVTFCSNPEQEAFEVSKPFGEVTRRRRSEKNSLIEVATIVHVGGAINF